MAAAAWKRSHPIRGARFILRPGELLRPAKGQCASRRFSELLPCFELSQALELLVDALDGRDENLVSLVGMHRRPRKALAPRLGLSLGLASSMPREGAFLATEVPKHRAKVLEPFPVDFRNCGVVGVSNDFLFVLPQNAEFKLAGSGHRILLV
jgi:hypothetical protein